VVDPRCKVVPPAAVLPFFEAAGSTDKRLLHYDGDVGVSLQHVGLLVGPQAHARLWPEITGWVQRCAGADDADQRRFDAAA
jgi:polyhydroxyalkanoate synthase subunit PhaC